MTSPYEHLPSSAFWRSGVCATPPTNMQGIFKKKWGISPELKVATAGSCFAQHIARYMRRNGFSVMDVELTPEHIPLGEQEKWGYGLYSARFGNIYTVHQLLQLAKEAFAELCPQDIAWEKDGRYYDALRPAVQPGGFASPQDLHDERDSHLSSVRRMFVESDVLVFTLGLTEAWVHRPSQTIFPTAPETMAGIFDSDLYGFKNFNFSEIVGAFEELVMLLRKHRRGRRELKFLLTVSPVPLTATAAGKHVLQASTYSKSVLRAVAGYLSDQYDYVDYFPSYEIITNPAAKSSFYDDNLRTVKAAGVESVMSVFFFEHGQSLARDLGSGGLVVNDDLQCEEVLLETFSKKNDQVLKGRKKYLIFIGDSHLSGVKRCVEKSFKKICENYNVLYIPVSWMRHPFMDVEASKNFSVLDLKDEYQQFFESLPSAEELSSGAHLCFVGLGLLGDGVVRAYGAMNAGESKLSGGSAPDNPILPIIATEHKVDEVLRGDTLLADIDGFEFTRKKYIHNINLRINIFNKVSAAGVYDTVHWIVSPNMVERTARFRFGDVYVDSRSHSLHTRIAESYIDEYNVKNGKKGWLIKHSTEFELKSGFTKDEYAFNESFYDIHTSADFYEHALSCYFRAIT